MAESRRKTTRNTRRADAVLGYLIPIFFIVLAAYQQIRTAHIDKYVIGALLVFGLGALGWRIDTLFEKYIEAKAAAARPPERDEDADE